MKKIITIFLMTFSYLSLAGPIPGVPNDLRRQFKSSHKFVEVDVYFDTAKVKARINPVNNKAAFYYHVPKSIRTKVLNHLRINDLPTGITISNEAANTKDNFQEYKVFYRGHEIDDSWIRIYKVDDKELAIGLKLPLDGEAINFKDGLNSKFFLHNDKVIAYREDKNNRIFPKESGLKNREVKVLKAVLNSQGTVDRFKVPKGSFPDQIVLDKTGNLWFTQPSDRYLTRFHPLNGDWEHITVGISPDGLTIAQDGTLWFGEYNDRSLGFYNPVNQAYEQIDLPYENSSPAIPFEDRNGLIWISDHRSNKVSVYNRDLNSWNVYEPPKEKSWIVQVIEGEATGDIFATHCYANSIGRIDYMTRNYTEVDLGISSCPAFFASIEEFLYITLWSQGSLMRLNTFNDAIVEYKIENEVWSESGTGPISRDSQGNIYFASLNDGRVYRFNPKTEVLDFLSGIGKTKDGLAVSPDGTIWITDTTGYIVRAVF